MTHPFRVEALSEKHDRAAFACGQEALDRYLRTHATQDIRRRVANCFVAIEGATAKLAAYYTIASASIPTPQLPPEMIKRLPRYPTLPAVRIGRLAVDLKFRERGLGAAILADAASRAAQAPPAVFALLVDAKNDDAAAFYRRYGFRAFVTQDRTLFLPMATAEKLLG